MSARVRQSTEICRAFDIFQTLRLTKNCVVTNFLNWRNMYFLFYKVGCQTFRSMWIMYIFEVEAQWKPLLGINRSDNLIFIMIVFNPMRKTGKFCDFKPNPIIAPLKRDSLLWTRCSLLWSVFLSSEPDFRMNPYTTPWTRIRRVRYVASVFISGAVKEPS